METFISIPETISGYPIFRGQFSVIVPDASRNLVVNPSVEIDLTGYTAVGGATTISRIASYQRRGIWGIQVSPAAGVDAGVYYSPVSTTVGRPYTFSFDFLGHKQDTYRCFIADNAGNPLSIIKQFSGKSFWQRISVTFIETTTSATRRLYVQRLNGGSTTAFYLDGFQFEEKPYPTTYIDGDQEGLIAETLEYYWDGVPHASTSYRIQDTRAGGRELFFTSDLHFEVTGVSGLGMPPIENVSVQSNLGGAFYQGTVKRERTFTISGVISTDDKMADLHSIRAGLIAAFNPLSITNPMPLKIGWHDIRNGEEICEPIYFICSYTAGLEGFIDNPAQERISLTFTEWQPCGFEDGEKAVELERVSILAGNNKLIRKNKITNRWETGFESPAIDGNIIKLIEGNDGYIYFAAQFTLGGGANNYRFCRLNPLTGVVTGLGDTGGGTAAHVIHDISLNPANGRIGIVGAFTTINGTTVNRVTEYDPSTGSFRVFSNAGNIGCNDVVRAVIYTYNGVMVIGGDFTQATGVAINRLCRWGASSSIFVSLGTGANGSVYALETDAAGTTTYIGGAFTTLGGASHYNCGRYYSGAFGASLDQGLTTGAGTRVIALKRAKNGTLYCIYFDGIAYSAMVRTGGQWTYLPGFAYMSGATAEYLARHYDTDAMWIGTTTSMFFSDWFYMGHVLYQNGGYTRENIDKGTKPILDTAKYLYMGGSSPAATTGITDISYKMRNREIAVPDFVIYGIAYLQNIENVSKGVRSYFDMSISRGVLARLRFDPKDLQFIISTGVNLLSVLKGGSTLSGYEFDKSHPLAGIYLSGTGSWESFNDNNAQLEAYHFITGIKSTNTDGFTLYFSIISDGGGFYHVNIYKNAARGAGDLVGHTASYNSTGYKEIIEDNTSGLGGYIRVANVIGADTDIYVNFGYGFVKWKPMYNSIDEASL